MSGSAPEFGQRSEFYTFAPETLAQELPEFTIRREVGKGSMGIVYDAIRKQDQLRVALKVLPPSLTLDGHMGPLSRIARRIAGWWTWGLIASGLLFLAGIVRFGVKAKKSEPAWFAT